MTTACDIRVLIFKNEYATLDKFGIPLRNIIRVPVYESVLMITPIFISSFIGSYAVTKLIHMMISGEYKIIYSFPVSVFIIVLVLLLFVEAVCSVSVVRLIKRKINTNLD